MLVQVYTTFESIGVEILTTQGLKTGYVIIYLKVDKTPDTLGSLKLENQPGDGLGLSLGCSGSSGFSTPDLA